MVSYKNMIFTILAFLFLHGCSNLKRGKKYYNKEYEKIEQCRKEWSYESFKGVIELELLYFNRRKSGTSVSHPNFFIGIDSSKDTIGIMDYYSNNIFSEGNRVKFMPDKDKAEISRIKSSMSNEPVFYIANSQKENNLQCAVKKIYYGKVIEE